MKIKLNDDKWVTEDYKKLLWILEHNDRFEKEVFKLRKTYKRSEKLPDEAIVKLLDEYNLPQNMLREMKSFIIEGFMSSLILEPGIEVQSQGITINMLRGKESPKGKRREVRIKITKKITKTKLIEWIDENWDSIEFNMLSIDLPEVKIPKWKLLDLVKQVVELRDEQNLTFSEITERLKQSDEDYIKTLYHRYKKRSR